MRAYLVMAMLSGVWCARAHASPEREAATHYSAGTRAFEEGDFSRAADELKASLAAKPTVKVLLMLGNTYVKLGQLEDAKATFEQVLQLDPRSSKRKTVEALIAQIDSLSRTKLVINSTPPGATIYLDMKADGARGKTPLTLPALPGRHRVIFELEGYELVTIPEVTAVEGQEVPVSASLQLRGCDVTLSATPNGATVRIDGGGLVPLPATRRLPTGEHRLEFGGEGLQPKARALLCEERALTVSETLTSLPLGLLAIHAPQGATVKVDGASMTAQAASHLQLAPGVHTIDVELSGRVPWRTSTMVRNGDQTELTPRLDAPLVEERPAAVQVVPEPRWASIRVDGRPLRVDERYAVAPGRHEVEIKARGHKTYWRIIDLGAGEVLHVDARLPRRGVNAAISGAIFTMLALGAEGVALAAHFSAEREAAGTSDYNSWHNTELGGHIVAGSFGFAALISFGAAIGLSAVEGEADRTPQINFSATQQGGAFAVSGRF